MENPYQSQRQTQPKSNTEGEKKEEVEEEEERMAESKSDDEEKGSFSSEEKKKGKMPMKAKKQKYRNINEMMYGAGGKPKGVVIGGRATANECDGEKPPASKRRRHAHTEVKCSYSLLSEHKDSEDKEPKGKEKEQEIHQNIAKDESDSLEPEIREIYIKLEELSW